ncbi:mTERF domain-containing protein 1 mitochondrial [Trichostrongylus colubriformis]|uniref:mTERF domain-containing protein 1 mitochondrial n=1 Tax=Trichostrongylus colubriformis TaxID=6319 RepID=A0AAN8G656_TRICO
MAVNEEQAVEMEVLQSIYGADSNFKAIGDNRVQYKFGVDTSKSFVVEIEWPPEYPTVPPKINMDVFYNSNIADNVRQDIKNKLLEVAKDNDGMAVTFTLIDYVSSNFEEITSNWDVKQPSPEADTNAEERRTARDEPLTKAAKRRLWDRNEGTAKERGSDWIDILKHLAQMFSSKLLRMVLRCQIRSTWVRESSVATEFVDSEHQKASTEEGPSRSGRPIDKEKEQVLRETRKRIKRWRARNAYLPEPAEESDEGSSEVGLRRISEVEFVQKVEEEEREWAERAEDLISNLSFVSADEQNGVKPPPPSTKWSELSPEQLELKRKTGKAVFRSIIYNEGELQGSDLNLPPSVANPHPFDPSKHAPPVYTRSVVPFVNRSPLLQALVDIGVNLFEVEQTTRVAGHLLRLDINEVKPKLQWLASLGFEVSDLGEYLTRNPFFLIQDLSDMQARVNYLTSMKFTNEDVCKIIKDFRYWLNVDVKTMDSRLGWIQQQFRLSGDEVRNLIRKEARVIMFGLGPLQRLVTLFNKELEFSPKEMKNILLNDPRVFMMDPKFLIASHAYLHRIMRLSNSIIAKHPFILRCSHSSIRTRHEFLKKLGRAVYEGAIVDDKVEDSSKDKNDCEPVPIEVFLDPSDEVFVRKAANSYLVVYNNFLRNH